MNRNRREYLEYLIGPINPKEINSKDLVCLSTTIDLQPRNEHEEKIKKKLKYGKKRLENVAKASILLLYQLVSPLTASWLHKLEIGKQKYLLHQKMLILRNGNKNTSHRNETKN